MDWARAGLNIGGDILAAGLGPVMGADVAPRIVYALSVLLPVVGVMALNRALFGGGHWWLIAPLVVAWQRTALAGFMNFQLGLGLALLAASAEPAMTSRPLWLKLVARAVAGCVILLFHPFAALMYAGLVFGFSAGPDLAWLRDARALRSRTVAAVLAVLAVAAPCAVIIALAPNPVPPSDTLMSWGRMDLIGRYNVITTGFQSYVPSFDLLTMVALAGIVSVAAWQRRLQVHAGLLLLGLGFLLVSPLVPAHIGGAGWVDRRLPVMAVLVLVAAVRPNLEVSAPTLRVLAGLLLSIALLRTGEVATAWAGTARDLGSIRTAVAYMPVGARLVTVADDPADRSDAPFGRYLRGHPMYWNYPSLAVRWRHAFVPNLFTQSGQQPLRVAASIDPISVPFGAPPGVAALARPSAKDPQYMRHWRSCFDYVLVLNADVAPAAAASVPVRELQLVRDEGFAELYRNPRASRAACTTALKGLPLRG
ncbi:MAG: hypothetical protein DI570_24310 [Phenylobacterium zucineum]|nr:MAG: hypothetical protein DI570_24310 [Phenylobacterium zucineum]